MYRYLKNIYPGFSGLNVMKGMIILANPMPLKIVINRIGVDNQLLF